MRLKNLRHASETKLEYRLPEAIGFVFVAQELRVVCLNRLAICGYFEISGYIQLVV